MIQEKIKTIKELEGIIEIHKNQGKKIVLCHGCFDFLHYGHIEHFLDAKKNGDILVVTVTPDRFIQKGPNRPFFNEEMRLNHISSIEFVDYVALNEWETAIETIKILKPDIYAKGREVLGNKNIDELKISGEKKSNLAAEIEVLESIGGKIYLTDKVTFSSSNIINQFTDILSEDAKNFINELKKRYSPESIIDLIESLKDLRVLVIGDAVLNEYIFTKSLDKSGKEPFVAYMNLYSEIQTGGVFAVANQISCFSDNVSILTCISGNDYEFIDKHLSMNIERNIFIQNESKTIKKTRYMDEYRKLKLFEVYNNDELEMNKETEQRILKFLEMNLSRFDMIVCVDFGHGTISDEIMDFLCESNKYLAVNTQLNAGNMGYNFITKYKRADYISLNDKEIRLPFQEKKSDIRVPMGKLSKFFNISKINVTRGKFGSICLYNGTFYSCPAFTKEPVDTIGAGDKILSLTSLLSYKDVDPNVFSFLGNVIGGLSVKMIGNHSTIPIGEIKKFIHYIMK